MHKKYFLLLILSAFALLSFHCRQSVTKFQSVSLDSAHFFLNAFGVESSGFPTIIADINFLKKEATCNATYYEPWYKPKSYKLSPQEIDTLALLIKNVNWGNFKKNFSTGKTDQPASTVTINMNGKRFEIKDYGLEGDKPLPELYRIVYKLHQNFQ